MNGRSRCVRTGFGPLTRRPRQRNRRRRTRTRGGRPTLERQPRRLRREPPSPADGLGIVPGTAGRILGGMSLRHPRAGAATPPVHDAGRILGGTSLRQPRTRAGDPGRDPGRDAAGRRPP